MPGGGRRAAPASSRSDSGPAFRLCGWREVERSALLALLDGTQAFERGIANDRAKSGPAFARRYGQYLARRAARGRGWFLVAAVDGCAAGIIAFWIVTEDHPIIAQSWRRCGYVAGLFVAPAFRRRGVATALLAAAKRHFSKHGVPRVMLNVLAANRAARALYDRAGYEPYEVTMQMRVMIDDQPR